MSAFTDLVQRRRAALADRSMPAGSGQLWGLALSGGGIRSATFCFGLLRALAKNALLLRFDAISTVSGGGYIGAALGRLFHRAANPAGVRQVAEGIADADSRWFAWWLRANGRYLIPQGAKDSTFAAALYIRNLVAVHFELGLLAILLGVVLAVVDALGWSLAAAAGSLVGTPFFDLARFLPDWLPVVSFAIPFIALFGAVAAAAYWCVPWLLAPGPSTRHQVVGYWIGAFALLIGLILVKGRLDAIQTEVGATLRTLTWWVALVLLVIWLASVPMALSFLKRTTGELRLRAEAARNDLTLRLANCLRLAAVVALAGAVDRFAWFLAFEAQDLRQVQAGLALAVVAAVTRAALPVISQMLQGSTSRGSTSQGLLLFVGRLLGYALTFLLCSWWISLVYRAALGAAFQRVSPNFGDTAFVLAAIGLPTLGYLVLTGRNLSFLNLSSLHAFYRGRLVRSYLGAANAQRFDSPNALGALDKLPVPMPVWPKNVAVSDLQDDDDIAFASYRPHRHGGPIHLINVCINQTKDPRGGLFNQDRKGLSLTVASGGAMKISQSGWTPLTGDGALTLGTWTAISGAAVAPGLGNLSRGGISALATFAGLRLGFWWDKATRTNASRPQSPFRAKSLGLLRETLGIFRGVEAPDWFLTDGGHFENTGAYALLSERAEVIVLADCGADPKYLFGDLENLVRKARIDLQAEILFQRPIGRPHKNATPPAGIDAKYHLARPEVKPPAWGRELAAFGSLNDLASPSSTACLALALVKYGGPTPSTGVLIVVKPNVAAGLPVDLINFKAHHPEFPQQPTADQFFSEAQWESYYQLGQALGGKLTKPFVDSIVADPGRFFEADEESPFADKPARADDAASSLVATATRLPARIGASAVGASIGLGAAVTVGVSAWQAIDSARSAQAKQVSDEHGALKELTDLWAKLPPPSAAAAPASSVAALAAAIVRTADTLCPVNEAGWFQRSVVAGTIRDTALLECQKLGRDLPGPCTTLLEAAAPALQSPLPKCLYRKEDFTNAVPPPHYWVFDYSAEAPFATAHPCDPVAASRRATDDLYRTGRLSLGGAASARLLDDAGALPSTCPQFGAMSWWKVVSSLVGGVPVAPSSVVQTVPAPPPGASVPSAHIGAAPMSIGSAEDASASAPPKGGVCEGRTVYVQIYGPAQRDAVRAFREPWRQLGASVPPIEDTLASARAAGRAPPLAVTAPTVRIHDADSRPCAEALVKAVAHPEWLIQPLSPRLRATKGVIEVWVPPS